MQNNSNQITQIPQTGANMQGTPFGLFQVQEGNDTMVIRQEGRQMVKYRVVNGGNAGPILARVDYPKWSIDREERIGELCPTCGKGILLLDMDCVRNKANPCLQQADFFCCILCPFISWPFVGGYCCYIKFCKKRLCTSCNQEFPTECCPTPSRMR